MEEAKQAVIPTRFKARISHLLSFPIGAERISKVLAGTPQIGKLFLHFSSDRRSQIIDSGRYPCIRIQHSSRQAEMAQRCLSSGKAPLFNEWEIRVYPVPRIHRHRVQRYIVDAALPELNKWLYCRAELQQPGEDSLTFFFDERKDEFTQESEMQLQPQRE